jgi:hypothetical protein
MSGWQKKPMQRVKWPCSRRGARAFRRGKGRNSSRDETRQATSTQDNAHLHVMEGNDEDEDIKLARASAGLLADLESCLQKVLWKPSQNHTAHGRVHSRVRQKDLDYIINLVGPSP